MTLLLRWRWGRTSPVRRDRRARRWWRCGLCWRICSGSWSDQELVCRWSSLHDTAPVGGPPDQPRYCNAVMLVEGLQAPPSVAAALELLDELQGLEQQFGRNRSQEQRWGPRSLDLDLLFWGELRLEHPRLQLPHPRLHLRRFVLAPLLEAMQGSAAP